MNENHFQAPGRYLVESSWQLFISKEHLMPWVGRAFAWYVALRPLFTCFLQMLIIARRMGSPGSKKFRKEHPWEECLWPPGEESRTHRGRSGAGVQVWPAPRGARMVCRAVGLRWLGFCVSEAISPWSWSFP